MHYFCKCVFGDGTEEFYANLCCVYVIESGKIQYFADSIKIATLSIIIIIIMSELQVC